MSLKLVWSNPCPSTNAAAEIRRIMKDECGSLYLACYPDGCEEFELTTGTKRATQKTLELPETA